MEGDQSIPAGEIELIKLEGKYDIISSLGSSEKHQPVYVEIAKSRLMPKCFDLSQNYPNPFNPTTTIAFSLPEPCHATLTIYNTIGQKVTTIVNQFYPEGTHEVNWNSQDDYGKRVSSGIYFYKLETDVFTDTKKMILLK